MSETEITGASEVADARVFRVNEKPGGWGFESVDTAVVTVLPEQVICDCIANETGWKCEHIEYVEALLGGGDA